MLVRYWMSKPAITVEKTQTMQQAMALIKEKRIRLLPVTDNNQLCGVVSDRDLKRSSASDATSLDVHELLYLISKIKVAEIMTREVITMHQDWTMEEAADLMLLHKISGAPVVDDDGAISGVITQSDMFRATLYLTGLKKRGFQISLILEDTPGSIMEIANVIRQFGGRIASILSTYERAPSGYRNVYLRFYEVSRDRIDEMTEILKQKAKLRYLVDHRENRRMVFDKH
ncbi:CBS and ACT domain-containing protein [Desulfosarcina ovata]|uniref:Membrane protein n=2 Tax=Desulfosarcina ovata TaxID=83564 RepID=A0A5K8A3H3_9BACT|nr:CBS and ACT domain-containing protein [Desulfosarcina ovata]BBO80390.1 membrane protein [Desulfosarcina ovata subsp. sediminis]BBO87072.1 membrane protein [Desulfosarcina ovata subsp. ovata]